MYLYDRRCSEGNNFRQINKLTKGSAITETKTRWALFQVLFQALFQVLFQALFQALFQSKINALAHTNSTKRAPQDDPKSHVITPATPSSSSRISRKFLAMWKGSLTGRATTFSCGLPSRVLIWIHSPIEASELGKISKT